MHTTIESSSESMPRKFVPDGGERPEPHLFPMPWWKRALDLCCCLAALPLLALLTLPVAVLNAILSPGPVFFRQERVGHLGRRFQLYKFRTMHVAADTSRHEAYLAQLIGSGAPMQKLDLKGDSRLIPGGWLLRATGLDELPQIVNVLQGEMSIVGPRPCIPFEYDRYSPYQRQRFAVLPGLTGLWQVSGKNRTTFDEMIEFDLRYAAERSPGLDLKIILMTIPALCLQVADTLSAGKAQAGPTTAAP